MRQARVPLHRIKVAGDPASFATRGEVPWTERLERALGGVAFDPAGTVLSLDFVISARPGHPMGPGIDDLCEPVIAVVAGRLGWFGGQRFEIRGLWARKRVGTPVGCEVSVFPDWVQAPLGKVPVLLDATWAGELPRSGRDLVFAQWVGRELRALPSPGSRLAVRVEFAGRPEHRRHVHRSAEERHRRALADPRRDARCARWFACGHPGRDPGRQTRRQPAGDSAEPGPDPADRGDVGLGNVAPQPGSASAPRTVPPPMPERHGPTVERRLAGPVMPRRHHGTIPAFP